MLEGVLKVGARPRQNQKREVMQNETYKINALIEFDQAGAVTATDKAILAIECIQEMIREKSSLGRTALEYFGHLTERELHIVIAGAVMQADTLRANGSIKLVEVSCK